MQHAFTLGTPDNATVGNTSTKVLDSKSGRTYAVVINDSDEAMYLGFGAAAVLNKGVRLNANGGSFELNGDEPFRGEVYAICASGGKNACFLDCDV